MTLASVYELSYHDRGFNAYLQSKVERDFFYVMQKNHVLVLERSYSYKPNSAVYVCLIKRQPEHSVDKAHPSQCLGVTTGCFRITVKSKTRRIRPLFHLKCFSQSFLDLILRDIFLS